MQNSSYANTFAVSQSSIKDFRFKSPKRWKLIHIDKQEDLDKPEESFTFGSLMDTMMFSTEELDTRFYVGKLKTPSKAIESICKSIYSNIILKNKIIEEDNKGPIPNEVPLIEFNLEAVKDLILKACDDYQYNEDGEDKTGWNKGWKEDTRVNKIIEKGSDYFYSLVKANGRKVISQDVNFKAIELKGILEKDESVKCYFLPSEDIELLFQLEIFVEYTTEIGKKMPLKGALDILQINHKLKTIQIADFKTTYSAFDFTSSIRKYGYATQLSYYDFLLRLWLDSECKGKYCDYTILNPINIVIDEYDKVPYLYEYSWQDLNLERDGNEEFLRNLYETSTHNSRIKKGWMQLLEEISWHYHNDLWDKSKELYENGKIKVNLLN